MEKESEKVDKNAKKSGILVAIIAFCIMAIAAQVLDGSKIKKFPEIAYKEDTFSIIASSENKELEDVLLSFAEKQGLDVEIEYAGTIEIMDKLNSGEKYDAVWTSNSIWLYMLNENVNIKNSKSTSINPVVFGITKSKAQELGFIDKEIYVKDIVEAIENKKLKFNMPSVTQTNTGATAYLGFLTTLAGNPEILREEDLEKEELKQSLISLFSGVERSSGTEEFLEELFLTGNYDAVVTYEASIININKPFT